MRSFSRVNFCHQTRRKLLFGNRDTQKNQPNEPGIESWRNRIENILIRASLKVLNIRIKWNTFKIFLIDRRSYYLKAKIYSKRVFENRTLLTKSQLKKQLLFSNNKFNFKELQNKLLRSLPASEKKIPLQFILKRIIYFA